MPDNKSIQTGEVVKRKRGRPPKNKNNTTGIVNEGETRITMENSTGGSTPSLSQEEYERISLQQVQAKWNSVFSKYSSLLANGGTVSLQDTIWGNPAKTNRLNPFVQNQRVKSIISQGAQVDKSNITKWCERPADNEFNIQNASWAMYYQSQVYQSLLRIDREVPRFHAYAVPENIEAEDLHKDSYKKEKQKVNSILKVLKPKITFKDIIVQMENEGKVTMLPRVSYNDKEAFFFTFQKLPNQYCKIVGFGSDEHFVVMFNMVLFLSGVYDPASYPEFIQRKWETMIRDGTVIELQGGGYKLNTSAEIPDGDILEADGDSWFYWYRIPQEMAFTFSQDGGSPNVLPDTVGLLQDVVDLADYKALQQSLLARGATAILTAEAQVKTDTPVGKDGTYVSPETLLGITDYVIQNVGETIVPVFFPLQNFQLHSIQEDVSPATAVVSSRIKDVMNTSALGGLMSTTDKPSIITVKTARDLEEAKMRYYVSQFENAVNRVINNSFDLKYKWKVNFCGYCFSELDDLKLMKELILSGVKGLLPRYLAYYDLTIEDYSTMYNMVEACGVKIIKDELIYQIEATKEMQGEQIEATEDMQDKALNANLKGQQISAGAKLGKSVKIKDTGINETKKRGRPIKSDTEISDATAASREGGGNDSEIKNFIMDTFASDFEPDELEEVIAEEVMREIEYNDGRKLNS